MAITFSIMKKRTKTILRVIIISVLAIIVVGLLGRSSISNFILKKVLFTPYNIVGFIMAIATLFGFHITKRQGHWLKTTITIICGFASVVSFVGTILGWFEIDIGKMIWNVIFEPAIITVSTVLIWIFIVIVAISLIIVAIYGILALANKIRNKHNDRKTNEIIYVKQKVLPTANNRNKYRVAKIQFDDGVRVPHIDTLQPKVSTNNATKSVCVGESLEEKVESHNEDKLKKIVGFEEKRNIVINICSDNELSEADEIDISNNVCPKCGWYLIKRINKETGEQFRGCTNYGYHNCTFTVSDDQYLKIYRKYH